jgi:hypothetical protein
VTCNGLLQRHLKPLSRQQSTRPWAIQEPEESVTGRIESNLERLRRRKRPAKSMLGSHASPGVEELSGNLCCRVSRSIVRSRHRTEGSSNNSCVLCVFSMLRTRGWHLHMFCTVYQIRQSKRVDSACIHFSDLRPYESGPRHRGVLAPRLVFMLY